MNFIKYILFDGTIPLEIDSLTNLVYLWVEDNALSGTLSTEIGKMSSLASLDLDKNDLDGTLSMEITILANLFDFELSYASFTIQSIAIIACLQTFTFPSTSATSGSSVRNGMKYRGTF
jgi:hypothetical protein